MAHRKLANAIQKKLRMAGRTEEANHITILFHMPDAEWHEVIEDLSLSYSQEIANNDTIHEFGKNFDWQENPVGQVLSAVAYMGIKSDASISSDKDGVRLFRTLIAVLPKFAGVIFGVILLGVRDGKWIDALKKLADIWNSEHGARIPVVNQLPQGNPTSLAASEMQFSMMDSVKALMLPPVGISLVRWVQNNLRFINSGNGDTAADIILTNVMVDMLKEYGRMKDADFLAIFTVDSCWEDTLRALSLTCDQRIANGKMIKEFTESFTWQEKPMVAIYPALSTMSIDKKDIISANTDGLQLYQRIVASLLRNVITLRCNERGTWRELAMELQARWNSEVLYHQVLNEFDY